MRDFESHNDLIKHLELMPQSDYENYIKNIKACRDEIFDKFSTKNNFVIPVYEWYKKNFNNNLKYSSSFFENIENDVLTKKFDDGLKFKLKIKNLLRKSVFYFQKVRG